MISLTMFARTPPGDLAVVRFATHRMGHTVGMPFVLDNGGGSLVPMSAT